jgi:hypothetical protein
MKTPSLYKSALLALLVVATGDFALAQKPTTTNAQVQELSAGGGLKPAIDSILQKQAEPAWIGYRIPTVAREHTMCCFDGLGDDSNCCAGCRLESGSNGRSSEGWSGRSAIGCSSPEPLPYAFVFLRVEDNQIGKIRVFSGDCPLDFSNLPVYWLEDARPEQSIDFLVELAVSGAGSESRKKSPARQAVMAVAVHDSPAADQALERFMQRNQPERLREEAAFWLGVERGKKGLELLLKYVKDDPDDRFREKGTFALSQSKEPTAVKELIGMAHNDPSARVRGQAIFWIAQIGGRKEAEQITAAIENDPETEVKNKAVFALSQMHDGEGVPLLINVARTNKNPAVRKKAIFWLGQSHDPRALDFLEELLTK